MPKGSNHIKKSKTVKVNYSPLPRRASTSNFC
jgi:hypothetical protein